MPHALTRIAWNRRRVRRRAVLRFGTSFPAVVILTLAAGAYEPAQALTPQHSSSPTTSTRSWSRSTPSPRRAIPAAPPTRWRHGCRRPDSTAPMCTCPSRRRARSQEGRDCGGSFGPDHCLPHAEKPHIVPRRGSRPLCQTMPPRIAARLAQRIEDYDVQYSAAA
jgi:hypothetical protein